MAEIKSLPRKCYECGKSESVVPVAKPGRLVRYKDIKSIEIPAYVEILTCTNCGTEWLDEKTAKAIDKALEPIYQSLILKE